MTREEKIKQMKDIKEFSKTAVNPVFCITFLTRNLFKGYDNKTDSEILQEYEELE